MREEHAVDALLTTSIAKNTPDEVAPADQRRVLAVDQRPGSVSNLTARRMPPVAQGMSKQRYGSSGVIIAAPKAPKVQLRIPLCGSVPSVLKMRCRPP